MSSFLYAVSQAAGKLYQKWHGYDRSYNLRLAIGRSIDDSSLTWHRDDNEGWTVFPSKRDALLHARSSNTVHRGG